MRVTSDQLGTGVDTTAQLALIRNVAEDLKLPLARILAQLSTGSKTPEATDFMRETLLSAVDFIDTYILCAQVQSGQQQLLIEPVALPPLFDEAAHYLTPLASKHGYQISQHVPRTTKIVLSDKLLLTKLFTLLGYSFIQQTTLAPGHLRYEASVRQGRVNAGVLSSNISILKKDIKVLKSLEGRAGVLSANLPYGTSAGFAVADMLAQLMDNKLQPLGTKSRGGLGVSLLPSSQLALL